MKKIKKCIYFALICMVFVACDGDDNGSSSGNNGTDEKHIEYGVPYDVNLDTPCDGNGTWWTKTSDRLAKTYSARPIFGVNTFDAKIVINDWLVDIYVIDWENTNYCMTLLGVYACDYRSYLTGEVIKGYIDPETGTLNQGGELIYSGWTVDGGEFSYKDSNLPNGLWIKIKLAGTDRFWEDSLFPDN